MSNATYCGSGWFTFPLEKCAPCPPHTIGLDGLSCVRCPEDMYAMGFGNTLCSPCLGSNYTTDTLACPVLVPPYYYTAVGGTGVALFLFVLLIAAVCVVQQRSGMLTRLKIKIDSMALMRRLIGTNNEAAAEDVSYEVVDGIMNAEHDDDGDRLEPRVVRTDDASTLVLDDDGDGSILPEESVVDFENTGDLSNAVVTVNPPPPLHKPEESKS